MFRVTVYVTFVAWSISAAGVIHGYTMGYPTDDRSVYTYEDRLRFLENTMLKDKFWRPVLKEKVKMRPKPDVHLEQLDNAPEEERAAPAVTVIPMLEIATLMIERKFIGTEVAYAYEATRNAMACSLLKHNSMQGFLVHHLIAREPTSLVLPHVLKWLEQMLRISMDKLAAIDLRVQVIGHMHNEVMGMMDEDGNLDLNDDDLTNNNLHALSTGMYNELAKGCALDTNMPGYYRSLVTDLKRSMTADELKSLEKLIAEEELKGVPSLSNIYEINEYHGSLRIPEDIEPEGFETLNDIEIKKILSINRLKMNFVYLNLPVQSLAGSQWSRLFNLKKYITDDFEEDESFTMV